MNYIHPEANGQLTFSDSCSEFLMIPAGLPRFNNSFTETARSESDREVFVFYGSLDPFEDENICTHCGCKMHVNNTFDVNLRHLCFGSSLSSLRFKKVQYYCPDCHKTRMQEIPFKAADHRITTALEQYAMDLLALGYTNKEVAELTGLGKNTVKAIDKKRLQEKYTLDGKTLIKPERPTKLIGIDEFTLHNGYRYATHIVDLQTGHVLWIQAGKKKQVVYDFIDHVGMDWMEHVEAVACDMNSDFQEAFEERCEWIQPVFDYFHIVKNFNDKVVSEVRKDEQRRLLENGEIEAARSLKKTRYILTSKRSSLQRKDAEAREGKVVHKGSDLFGTEDIKRTEGYEAKYDELISQNKLLFTADLIKEKLHYAYSLMDEVNMAKEINEIIELCDETENEHFLWFSRLLSKHYTGIIAHATYQISTGKIEGINNKIKTLRRKGYGYPDDEYFFLKIIDASRRDYVRNPKSHRICD